MTFNWIDQTVDVLTSCLKNENCKSVMFIYGNSGNLHQCKFTFATMSKRKCLTLEDRFKVIQLLDAGRSSRVIASEFGVGRTQIQNVAKRKREIMEEYESGNPDAKRVKRTVSYEEIDELCYKWFLDATSRQINVSGPLLREKAMKFASDLGLNEFKGSTGWLDSFLKRHNIVLKKQSGERASVDISVVEDWKGKISAVCQGYEKKDIFNMDETGLFYRDTTKTTFFKKGEQCAGGKRSKDRITVALCASMTGEKIPPLVIGKSRRPRCFKSLSTDQLPVQYYANKKAWMTSSVMEDWLKWLDRRMKKKKRNILLFLDNAPSHPNIQLSNIKLQFFPANTTAICQPMDQGIIQTMKLKYRKRQLQHVLAEMDQHPTKTGPQILKDISVLQAINWINRAWNETCETTIQKCFNGAGFSVLDSSDNAVSGSVETDVNVDEDDFPLAIVKVARELFDCDIKELIEIDSLFYTCDNDMSHWEKPASELLASETCDDQDEEDEDESESVKNMPVSINDATDCINKLREFSLQIGNQHMFKCAMDFEDLLVEMRVAKNSQQKTITDFFNKCA